MPKTIQIRDLDDEVYRVLARRAAEQGISVPELLRREARKLAERPSMAEWLAKSKGVLSDITTEEILADLDAHRGPWPEPDAGR